MLCGKGGRVEDLFIQPVEALTHASGSRYFSLCAMLSKIFYLFFIFYFIFTFS